MTRLNAHSPLRVRARGSDTDHRSESSIEKKLRVMLLERGALCLKFVSPGNSGVPDRLVVLPGGRVVFTELKASDGSLSALQEWQIGRLRDLGAEVRVLRGAAQVREFVEEVLPR